MDAIEFNVEGQPVAQPRPRISTWGGRGRAYTPSGHPVNAYRQHIAIRASLAAKAARWAVADGPVALEVVAVFARPPSHLTKSVKGPARLRAGAPAFPAKNDWDNVGKAVSDAITDSGLVWVDDGQVVDSRVVKRYGQPGEQPGTRIRIVRLDAWPPAS